MQSQSEEVEFCLELGRSLQAYGMPAHRFEEALHGTAKALGLEGQFFAMPSGFLAWVKQGGAQQTFFLRSDSGATNLDKLSTLQEITIEVAAHTLPLRAASERLRRVLGSRPLFGPLAITLCSGVASGAFAVFFGAGFIELLGATVLGALLGALGSAGAGTRLEQLLPALGAAVVSALAVVIAHFFPGTSPPLITLAGIIVLVPGLSLVIAMNELATGNLVAGTARLTAAGMGFLQLAFGQALGQRLASVWLHPVAAATAFPLPVWTLYAALVVAPLCTLVLFQARPRDLPFILAASWLAFAGARLGTAALGPEFGTGLGAFILGAGSNLFARYLDRPAVVPLLPGLLVLVPGSVGYRSLSFLAERQTLSGIDTAVQMVFLAVSLLVGLLLSRAAVEPRRPL